MNEIATIPLFSIPVSLYSLQEVNQDEINKVLHNLNYKDMEKNHSLISESLNILNEYKELNKLKKFIDKSILDYSENIIGSDKCKLKLTTSWATKTQKGQSSKEHKHSNNIYSAVYYNESIENNGSIRFYKSNILSSFELKPKNFTVYNSTTWDLAPKEKTLIIFPSYLKHSIMVNNTNKTRYSIACNYHPIGNYGEKDSSIFNLKFV